MSETRRKVNWTQDFEFEVRLIDDVGNCAVCTAEIPPPSDEQIIEFAKWHIEQNPHARSVLMLPDPNTPGCLPLGWEREHSDVIGEIRLICPDCVVAKRAAFAERTNNIFAVIGPELAKQKAITPEEALQSPSSPPRIGEEVEAHVRKEWLRGIVVRIDEARELVTVRIKYENEERDLLFLWRQVRRILTLPRLRLGVAVLIEDHEQILLGCRGKQPNYGKWIIPGGGVEFGEHYLDAAKREILEETGLTVGIPHQQQPHVVEVLGENEHRIILFVRGLVSKYDKIKAGSDLLKVQFCSREMLSRSIRDGGIFENLSPVIVPVLQKFRWLPE